MTDASPVEALFAAALEKTDPTERARFLEEACAGNQALRAQVERLLAAHEKAGNFLRPPDSTGAYASAAAKDVATGTIVAGKYKLLQQIGEGGMGSVWMADQTEPVKRRVAVKLIRVERGQSKTVLSRFEAERQAIALMDHPNIAKLLDAGTTEEGSPFFVMELVKGVPLTEFCDAHRLSVPARLQLFMQVCLAVQHAHQKGVIHRDLKPSNVLVEDHDGRGVPKVIDFGLAKATTGLQLTEKTLFTAFGSVMGTPLYMAPEQANFSAVDVDTRADVYALGVILYELLTGTTPITRETIKKAQLDEMLKLIREQDAPTPSSRLSTLESAPSVAANRQSEPAKLSRFVKGELDWIVLKALAKERDRRYETANGFAKDVERFLNQEPVTAGPPTAGYKLRKFVQRNRGQVIAASVVMIAVLGGLVMFYGGATAAWYGLKRARVAEQAAREDKEDAVKQRDKADRQRAKAEKARDRTRDVLDAMTSEATGDSMATQVELSEEQKKFLGQALTYYKELADEGTEDEPTRARSARAAARVAKIEYRFMRGDEALVANRAAIERLASLAADFPTMAEYREELFKAHRDQAVIFSDHRADHLESHQHVLSGFAVLSKLVEDFPAEPRYRAELAVVHLMLEQELPRFGKKAEALEHGRKAQELLDMLVVELAARPDRRGQFADQLVTQGWMFINSGKPNEAETPFRRALSIRRELAAENPTSTEHRANLERFHNQFAAMLRQIGKPSEAEEYARKGLAFNESRVADFPAAPTYRSSLAGSHAGLGDLLGALGKSAEAETHYRKSIAIREKLVEDFPKRSHARWLLGGLYGAFGDFLRDADKLEDSLIWYEKSIRTLAPIVQEKPRSILSVGDTVHSLRSRAGVLARLNRHGEALGDWDRVVELSDADRLPSVRAYRACARIRAGKVDAAVAEVAELLQSSNWNAIQWYNFACVYALAGGKVASKRKEYGDRAMELLHKAVQAGYKDADQMKKDGDFDSIKSRDDFKKLLAELEAKSVPPKKASK